MGISIVTDIYITGNNKDNLTVLKLTKVDM